MKRASIVGTIAILAIATLWILRLRSANDNPTIRPVLALNLRDATQSTIVPGTPVPFEISLSGLSDGPRFTIGNRWQPWMELIEVAVQRDNAPAPVAATRVGQAGGFRVTRQAADSGRVESRTDGAALIEAREYLYVTELVITPDDSARLTAGRYSIVATLATPWWQAWGWRGRVVSAPLHFDVRPASEALNRQRLAATAAYWLRAGDSGHAERAARELIAAVPSSVAGHMFLGDALARQNRTMEALDAFSQAVGLAQPFPGGEPPLRIFRMAALFTKKEGQRTAAR